MRLVFLTPQLPHPAVSGGVIKSRKLLEYLAARYDVYLCSLLKPDDENYIDELKKIVNISGFYGVPVSIPRTALNFIRSIMAGVPLSVYRNRSRAMQLKVGEILSGVDVVFVDHFLMFQYVPKDIDERVILHEHNAEYVMWKRFAALEQNPLKKLVAHAEAGRIRRYEANIGKRAHAILAAPNDIKALGAIGVPSERMQETLHLGDDKLLDYPDIEYVNTKSILVSVGSLDWEANRDGLLWFLREVWPELIDRQPWLRFIIIGRNPGEMLERRVEELPGVNLLGYVEDLEQHYAQSRVFVAPLRFGSGIKVKIINALYRGIPVSTTSIGAEGLEVVSGREMYIADAPREMARQIGILLESESQWTKVRVAARNLAKKKYTWQSTLARVDEAING